MTGIVITQAALHALLTDAHLALVGHRVEFAGTVLHTLRRLTEPAADVSRSPLADLGFSGPMIVESPETAAGGGCAGTGDHANRDGGSGGLSSPANAGTPAPPTIDLPAGPDGAAIPVALEPPAADGAPPAPEAPPPAQAAEGRPAGTITRRGSQTPRTPPAARHAPPR
jgi:hypothetical protein